MHGFIWHTSIPRDFRISRFLAHRMSSGDSKASFSFLVRLFGARNDYVSALIPPLSCEHDPRDIAGKPAASRGTEAEAYVTFECLQIHMQEEEKLIFPYGSQLSNAPVVDTVAYQISPLPNTRYVGSLVSRIDNGVM